MKRLIAAAAVLALATPLAAQDMPESYRQIQQQQLTAQRRMALAMADSMPERLYRDKATPAQRDFAQQVQHIPFGMQFVTARFLGVQPPTGLPDTAAVFNTRAGLRLYINTVYDWAEGVLRNQTAEQRAATINVFGNSMPGWKLWDEMHQHAWWTAGQIVANFRKNGMAPPGFFFY